jgi:crotonobetainyl-CoA hydratase
MSDFFKISRNGQTLEIVLDRPKANAQNAPSCREMGRLFADFRDDPEPQSRDIDGCGGEFSFAG